MDLDKKHKNVEAHELLPDASVIMAVHAGVNYEHFTKAVDSIIGQTLPGFEFIVVCDGKLTLEQDAYIVSLTKDNARVLIVRLPENMGPGAARNAGIKRAKGKYIAIMDSDDIALPYRLEIQFDYLEAHKDVAVVGGFCDVIDDSDLITGSRKLPLSSNSLRFYSLFFCPLNNPTVMGRRKIFESYMYDEKLRQGEDYRLWVRLLKANYKIANISDVLIKFRVSSDLYKRRSGFHKGMSDIVNRLYAVQLSPVYLMPFVLLFAIGSFGVRFLPVGAIQFLTTSLERVRAKLID